MIPCFPALPYSSAVLKWPQEVSVTHSSLLNIFSILLLSFPDPMPSIITWLNDERLGATVLLEKSPTYYLRSHFLSLYPFSLSCCLLPSFALSLPLLLPWYSSAILNSFLVPSFWWGGPLAFCCWFLFPYLNFVLQSTFRSGWNRFSHQSCSLDNPIVALYHSCAFCLPADRSSCGSKLLSFYVCCSHRLLLLCRCLPLMLPGALCFAWY